MNEPSIRQLVVRVLYSLAEQQIGLAARRCIIAYTPSRAVHLVMP